jgi:hypothetical protein
MKVASALLADGMEDLEIMAFEHITTNEEFARAVEVLADATTQKDTEALLKAQGCSTGGSKKERITRLVKFAAGL